MPEIPAEQLTLLPDDKCPAWNTSGGTLYRAGYHVVGSELPATGADEHSRRRALVRWSLGAISFIGATATGIGVTEALRYLW